MPKPPPCNQYNGPHTLVRPKNKKNYCRKKPQKNGGAAAPKRKKPALNFNTVKRKIPVLNYMNNINAGRNYNNRLRANQLNTNKVTRPNVTFLKKKLKTLQKNSENARLDPYGSGAMHLQYYINLGNRMVKVRK